MPKREKKSSKRRAPRIVVFTGNPGVGKTHLVKQHVLHTEEAGFEGQWQLVKHHAPKKKNPQVVFHESIGGAVVVVGGYKWPEDKEFWGKRSGTQPANGGTDTLTPQSTGLVVELLRGELLRDGAEAPKLVIMEACAEAKLGRPTILDALLDAPTLDVLELQRPRAEAIAALESRPRDADGKGVKDVPAPEMHDQFSRQVAKVRTAFRTRALSRGIAQRTDAWRQVSYKEACDKIESILAEVMA